jgi:ribosomal protein S18 acetylase RimI-like enzyme
MIRQANLKDLDAIWQLRVETTELLKQRKINQWQYTLPSIETFKNDLFLGHFYVYEKDSNLLGMIAIKPGVEPTYLKIFDGNWIIEKPYLTIHRLAVKKSQLGLKVSEELIAFAEYLALKNNIHYIRIDTHKDNRFAIKLFENHGFILRGYILLNDLEGDPHRLAFDKILEDKRHENLG